MIRLLVRLIFWPVLLLLLLVALAPLTETGTRMVLESADRWLPLEIRYGGGRLAGELQLQRLAWASETVSLELRDVVVELSPGCLWQSKICFSQLLVEQLIIDVIPAADVVQGTGSEVEDSDAALLVFPVDLHAAALQINTTRITWDKGQWLQGILQGSVSISGSLIKVGQAMVADAHLELVDPDPEVPAAGGRIVMPGIDLPLELLVEHLQLEHPGWDVYGARGQLQSVSLTGSWSHIALQLDQLDIASREYGYASVSGQLDFSDNWPLSLKVSAEPVVTDWWPQPLERQVVIEASGDLAALDLRLQLGAATRVQLDGKVDTLDRALPFSASATAQWGDTLLPSQWLALPEALTQLKLASPLRLAASGSLQRQAFQLQGSGNMPESPLMELLLAGHHEDGLLTLDDMQLRDEADANILWGAGVVNLDQQIQWSARLESSGFDLPALGDAAAGAMSFKGRLEGGLHFSGHIGDGGDESWQLSISEADLEGEVNGLPASIRGYAGLDSNLQLAASELQAQLNGATLSLLVPAGAATAGLVTVDIPELGRWQTDSHGQLSLRAQLSRDWQQLQFAGSISNILLGGAEIVNGEIAGVYKRADGQVSSLDLTLNDASVGGIELSSLRLELDDDAAGQSLSLRSWGDLQSDLSVTGNFDGDGNWRGQLAATSVVTPQGDWRLDKPVAFNWSQPAASLAVAGHCWQHLRSKLCLSDWALGAQGGGRADLIGGMDLITALLPEGIELEGALDASLALSWSADTPVQVNGELHSHDWLMTRYYGVGESISVSWDQIDAVITRGEEGLELTAQGHRRGSRKVDLDLLLPAKREAPLRGRLVFDDLQLGILVPFAPSLAALEGDLSGDLNLQGTVDQPLLEGAVGLSGGRFVMVGNPTEFNQAELRIEFRGDRADISGRGLLGGGELDISGEAFTRPEAGLRLTLNGADHQLLVPPSIQMQVSEQLQLSLIGELLDVQGDIRIHNGILKQDQLPEGSVNVSPDTVIVDYAGNVVSREQVFTTSMNIKLLIDKKFRLVGTNINTTAGGDLHLLQSAGQPLQLFGNLNLFGGELRAYHQQLRIRRGVISFVGNPQNPELDVRAEREISGENTKAGVEVQGTVSEPRLLVYTDPVMSQGEAMSYLLRGRGLDAGAGSDGVAMALSMGTGIINQTELVTGLNNIPGLSDVAFGAQGTDDDTAATLGGYIGNRLYFSYGMGLYEPINVLTARLYLKSRLWLEVVSRLENSVDLYYSFDIE